LSNKNNIRNTLTHAETAMVGPECHPPASPAPPAEPAPDDVAERWQAEHRRLVAEREAAGMLRANAEAEADQIVVAAWRAEKRCGEDQARRDMSAVLGFRL
jgi:hypothetical protein